MAADVPAPWVDVQTDTFDIAEEALFQRRKRFKRALDSMRENSLTPAEQIAEFGSVEGAQQVLAASNYLLFLIEKRNRWRALPEEPAGKCVA